MVLENGAPTVRGAALFVLLNLKREAAST